MQKSEEHEYLQEKQEEFTFEETDDIISFMMKKKQ